MKKNTTRSQLGFSVVELIMLLVIVGLIGFIGYYVWHTKQNTDKSLNSATNTSLGANKSGSVIPVSEANWKGYCSTTENACFKYPADWTLEPQNASDPNDESVLLTGPGGLTASFQPNVSGLGGACDPSTTSHVFINKVIALPKVSNLYISEWGDKNKTTHLGVVGLDKGQAPTTGAEQILESYSYN
jgi:hypothetical protein